MLNKDFKVHMTHCYQGEYKYSCKYLNKDCPAKINISLTYEVEFCEDEILLIKWLIEDDINNNEFFGDSIFIRNGILNKLKSTTPNRVSKSEEKE